MGGDIRDSSAKAVLWYFDATYSAKAVVQLEKQQRPLLVRSGLIRLVPSVEDIGVIRQHLSSMMSCASMHYERILLIRYRFISRK